MNRFDDPDEEVTGCGWCGHEHPRGHDCGCVPCAVCGGHHGPEGAGDGW